MERINMFTKQATDDPLKIVCANDTVFNQHLTYFKLNDS